MSKGHGKVVFSKDKIVEINVGAGDLILKRNDDDNMLYFDTDDSFFSLKSYEDDSVVHIDVGKINLITGFLSSLGDLTVRIPKDIKIRINVSSGDVEAEGLILDKIEVSLKSGDLSIKNLNCNEGNFVLMNGDLLLDAEIKSLKAKSSNGGMSLYIKNDSENIILNSLLGDILLKLEKEPKVVEGSTLLGDFNINGKETNKIKGSGRCKAILSLTNGDANVICPVSSEVKKEDDEDIKKILKMLKEGKINKDEAAQLLDSLHFKKEVF